MYVDGQWTPAAGARTYDSVNPYTQQPWAHVADGGPADADTAVRAARDAVDGRWGAMSGFERAEVLRRLAELIARDAAELAACETLDNGKLLREMRGQLDYIPAWFRYFAGLADKVQGETIPSDRSNFFVYTRREPVGVVGAIVPWNSPLLLLTWKLAPALAAGCTMVVKPSDYTPASSLELARRIDEAEVPPGVVNFVTGRGPELGEALVSHQGVDKIAFTGSPGVGAQVAVAAGAQLTPVILELGGKSAQVVFDDADVGAVANGVIAGIFAASGQSCIAGSRLIVDERIADDVVNRIVARAREIRMGDPMEPETEMGPLANEQQLEKVMGFIDRAVEEGAKVATGGRVSPEQGGLFVEPTVLAGVRPESEIAREEVFGPVLAVMTFTSEDEAVRFANSTEYALGAGVWTATVGRAHRVAHMLRAGTVWINSYRVVGPNVPFGGTGSSGWGRENGVDAIREYTTTKSVWVELEGATRDPFKLG
jgi:acyl-CoA reductase-like NAD-dependent aldehyde dehydrogenase